MHGHDVEQRLSQMRRAAFRGPVAAGALADAGKGPVTDNTVTVGEILLRHAGFVKKMGAGLYIVAEDEGATVGIREG